MFTPFLLGHLAQLGDIQGLRHVVPAPAGGDGLLDLADRVHELQNRCAQSIFGIELRRHGDRGDLGGNQVGGQPGALARSSTFCVNANAG